MGSHSLDIGRISFLVIFLRSRCYLIGYDSGVAPYLRWSSGLCLWRPRLLLWWWVAGSAFRVKLSWWDVSVSLVMLKWYCGWDLPCRLRLSIGGRFRYVGRFIIGVCGLFDWTSLVGGGLLWVKNLVVRIGVIVRSRLVSMEALRWKRCLRWCASFRLGGGFVVWMRSRFTWWKLFGEETKVVKKKFLSPVWSGDRRSVLWRCL